MKENVCSFIVKNQYCTGCHACEIACTFHHNGYFSRRKASIEVQYDDVTGIAVIQHYKNNIGGHPGCDYCQGEDDFWCMKFCLPGAITVTCLQGKDK